MRTSYFSKKNSFDCDNMYVLHKLYALFFFKNKNISLASSSQIFVKLPRGIFTKAKGGGEGV